MVKSANPRGVNPFTAYSQVVSNMIALYFTLVPVLALIIWLVVHRKWKGLLWTAVSLVVLIVAGWYLFLYLVSEAFGPECEDHRVWKIEEYVIVKKICIGFAGPHYYPVHLYLDDKKIDQHAFTDDSSCILKFTTAPGDTLTFDICEKKLKQKTRPSQNPDHQ